MDSMTMLGGWLLSRDDIYFKFQAVEHEHISMPLSIMGDACRCPDGNKVYFDLQSVGFRCFNTPTDGLKRRM